MFGPRLAKFRIKKFQKEIEPQEILLDSLAQKKEKELGISEKKLEIPLSQRLLRGLWVAFLILILLLLGKTAQLQLLEGKNFSQLAAENKFVIRSIQAQRGVIYDKNLNQLVLNKPSFDLVCRLSDLPQDEAKRSEIFKKVSQILGQDNEKLKKEIYEVNQSEFLVAENLSHQTLILLEARRDEFPGFEVKSNMVREYLSGRVFSHLIGYQRKIGEKRGLEAYYDEILKAKPGELQVKRDVYGNAISKEIISLPESGQSLVLHLDADLQKKVSEVLARILRNVGAQTGAAIALDPQTGGVLALVSLPNFDNNLFSQVMSQEDWEMLFDNPQKPLFNRAIAGEYPTGSTIKPLIAAAVLEEDLIPSEKHILCQGLIEIEHRYDPEIVYKFHDWQTHGWTDLRGAIAESCNVYFYTVGGGYGDQEGLGPSRIKKYLELFGWGETSKIDLAGENEGLIPDPAWKQEVIGEGWWDGDTYYLSIGQGYILATPLQVVSAFAAIANGGILYQPQLVKEILDSEKNLIKEIQPVVVRGNFIDSQNLQIVKEGMREAVTYGSSILLNSLPVKAAAKTGTAQTAKEEVYHNWVTVFAPYDQPQIVLTVLIENIKGMQVASLPVAKDVLDWYFTRD